MKCSILQGPGRSGGILWDLWVTWAAGTAPRQPLLRTLHLRSWEQMSTDGLLPGTPPCTWPLAWAPPPSPSCSSKLVRLCSPSSPCTAGCPGTGQTPGPTSPVGGSVHPSLTGADVLCENDEPVSPSSSEPSSDTDADSEEQEQAMELGELPPAVERSTNPEPPAQGHGQAGHRLRRCHAPLDLTRSQKVCGMVGQTPGSVSVGPKHKWDRGQRDAPRRIPAPFHVLGGGVVWEGKRGLFGVLGDADTCLLVRRCGRSCCRPPSRAPRQSCPLPPSQVSSPSPPKSTVPRQSSTRVAARTGSL